MTKFAAAIVPAAIAAAGLAAFLHVPPPAHHRRGCAHVILSQQTATGQEADLPVRLCGRMARPGSWQCYVQPWGPLTANARLVCRKA